MTTYETYTDGGSTNMAINVFHKEDGTVNYKLIQYCCHTANELAQTLSQIRQMSKILKDSDYCFSPFAEEYLRNIHGIEDARDCPEFMDHEGFVWDCEECDISLLIDYDFHIVNTNFDLKYMVETWCSLYPKEQILLDKGTC